MEFLFFLTFIYIIIVKNSFDVDVLNVGVVDTCTYALSVQGRLTGQR